MAKRQLHGLDTVVQPRDDFVESLVDQGLRRQVPFGDLADVVANVLDGDFHPVEAAFNPVESPVHCVEALTSLR